MKFERIDIRLICFSGSSLAFSIEVTSYAVLSLLTLGSSHNLVLANKAVRWIASQVNANGGFVSTQVC